MRSGASCTAASGRIVERRFHGKLLSGKGKREGIVEAGDADASADIIARYRPARQHCVRNSDITHLRGGSGLLILGGTEVRKMPLLRCARSEKFRELFGRADSADSAELEQKYESMASMETQKLHALADFSRVLVVERGV